MMALVRAETERLWARRMTRFFPSILAALIVAGVAIAFAVLANSDTEVDFVSDLAGGVEATSLLGPVASLLPVMAFVIGASYIGADVKTGMLEQILTWEPRRLRVLGARLLAASVGAALLAMALGALLVALLYVLAASTGTTDGATGALWGNVAVSIVRLGIASGLFCAFGLAITTLVNNSVGSIVGFVIYWFIIESFLLSVFLPEVAAYLPVTNASAFASGSDVQRLEGSVFTGDPEIIDVHGYLAAGGYLVASTMVAVVAAALVFRRRDIA